METGIDFSWHHFFNLHINYVLGILELPKERLTKIFALVVISENVGCLNFGDNLITPEIKGCEKRN